MLSTCDRCRTHGGAVQVLATFHRCGGDTFVTTPSTSWVGSHDPEWRTGSKGSNVPFHPIENQPCRKRSRPTSETQGTCYRGGMEGMGRDPLPRTWDAGREAPGSLPGRGARRTTPQPIVGNCRQVEQTGSSWKFQWSKGNKSKPRQEREGSVYRSGSLADTGGFIANCSGNLSCLLR